ncbi:MAG TPA: SRPBCC family protein [Rubrobacteraceae bacterium]|jgi:ribosome-associated toxin RatA of RatAB toxin-antitoxin module|nr:SRPBCC family protein [Rubrobacteraceae bacterium]
MGSDVLGASLFVPSPARALYEAVLDVRGFPRWAPGVRRVEVIEGTPGPGMVSEWELSFLGLKRKVRSVLEVAEAPERLRWAYYEGPVNGWGECSIEELGRGALAEFRTELRMEEPMLQRLTRTSHAHGIAVGHLKRCLLRLGEAVSEDGALVQVGPLLVAG